VILVNDLDDPRLADYRLVAAPDALRRQGLFVVEGRLLLPRLLEARRFTTRSVLLTMAAWESVANAIDESRRDVPVYVVPQDTMNGLVGFNIHRGCLALAERPTIPSLADVDTSALRRIVILEGVNNPDNVGGLFRNAAAFDVDLVVLGPRCGDPFYRKAIRTSMGATLSVAIAEARAWPDDLERLREIGILLMALTPSPTAAPLSVTSGDIPRVALLFGAEGDGLSAEALEAADRRVRIETSPAVDSLNVATATAIALHHFATRARGG
jgi:tRNA G18 (ribose-2'-O)-methylase SpoU